MTEPETTDQVVRTVAVVHKQEWAAVLATLIRMTGDWGLAEDCTQDAFGRALETWRRDGIPANPGAWITTVAKNTARDRWRRARLESERMREVAQHMREDEEIGSHTDDDRLRLIFTCAHPALSLDARVALTLRTVGGLTTDEIARALLVTESTIAKRLVRARAKIRNAGIPYRIPPPEELAQRLSGVLAVLYLIFNEGYSATAGSELMRRELADEAIRQGRMLVLLMPREGEPLGLLALMLLQHSRTEARVDDAGDIIPLEEQDRGRWNQRMIEEGTSALRRATVRGEAGTYALQAAIAACHATATSFASTDTNRLVALYDRLLEVHPSPVIALNRAVALAQRDGPDAGLVALDDPALVHDLRGYYLLPAARADLLRRLGRTGEAAGAYLDAESLTQNPAERRYLRRRREALRFGHTPD